MASNGNDKKPDNGPDKQPGATNADQAAARKAKPGVTIDLAATEITKKEAPVTSQPDPKGQPEKAAAFPVDPVPGKTSEKPVGTGDGNAGEAKAGDKAGGQAPEPPAQDKPDRKPEVEKAQPIGQAGQAGQTSPSKQMGQPDQKGESRSFSGLFPAIIGGLVAIFGLIGLQLAGIVPSMSGGEDEALAELRQRVVTLEKIPAPKLPDPAQIDALTARVDAAEKAAGDALAAAQAALAALATQAEQATGSASTLPATVEERLRALETASPAAAGETQGRETGDPAAIAAIAALEEKITTFETALADFQAKIEADAAARGSAVDAAVRAGNEAGAAALADMKAALAVLSDKNDAVAEKLAGLAEKVAASESALAERANAASLVSDIAKTVALDNLKQRAASGAPFVDALSAVGKSGYPTERLSALEPYAASGLPAKSALDQTFERLIGTALAREGAPSSPEDASLSALDKLARNAMGLIGVRRVGGADAEKSPLGALEAAYRASDVAAFTAALEQLQPSQQALFTTFLADWKAVVALDALTGTAINGSGQ